MITIKLKPISINKAWQGRRFKTKEYTKWRKDFGLLVKFNQQKKIEPNCEGNYDICISVFLKNHKMFDIDNCIKPILDGLVENRIISDDRKIRSLSIVKTSVLSHDNNIEKIEVS